MAREKAQFQLPFDQVRDNVAELIADAMDELQESISKLRQRCSNKDTQGSVSQQEQEGLRRQLGITYYV